MQDAASNSTKKTASIALILAVLSLFIPYAGIALGIIAVIQAVGIKGVYPKETANYMLAQTAFIVGIVGTIWQCVSAVLSVWLANALSEAVRGLTYSGLLN